MVSAGSTYAGKYEARSWCVINYTVLPLLNKYYSGNNLCYYYFQETHQCQKNILSLSKRVRQRAAVHENLGYN